MNSIFGRLRIGDNGKFAQLVVWCSAGVVAWMTLMSDAQCADGRLELRVVDAESGSPLAARMRLENSRGRVLRIRRPNIFRSGDHFYFNGTITLELRQGQYAFELESGPEYRKRWGHFEIEHRSDDSKKVDMRRFANLASEGWWAGDLDLAAIPKSDLPTVLLAEQFHVAPFVDSTQAKSVDFEPQPIRSIHVIRPRYFGIAGHRADLLPGLTIFNSVWPIELTEANNSQTPKEVRLMRAVKTAGGQSVAVRADDLLLPVYLASGQLDAVQIIPSEPLNTNRLKRRDELRYPGKHGSGRFAEAIYHQILETGLRMAPAAGSGAANETGFIPANNRVYVHCGDEFSYERWWNGLVNGRVFVTNGPLLRPKVNGQLPGFVFRIRDGETIDLEIGLQLATRDNIEYLEIIKNGNVEREVRLDEWANEGGRLPIVQFDDSGWLVVRAVTDASDRYQFATCGAYFIEKDGKPRVSRSAVQFFLDWIDEATKSTELGESDGGWTWARMYWQRMRDEANAQ